MRFCSKEVQDCLLKGGIIRRKYSSNKYITFQMINNQLQTAFDDYYSLTEIDLNSDDWEITTDDWDYDTIIKNKNLCLFWNNDSDNYAIGHLIKVLDNSCHKFVSETYGNNQVRGIHWLHCKPFDRRDYVAGNIEKLRKFVK